MSNFMIFSLLGIVVIDIVLLAMILCHSHKNNSPENIVDIIGKALVKGEEHHGNVGCDPSNKAIYLLEVVKKKDLVADARMLRAWINALCDHLGVEIKVHLAEAERWVAVKKDKKA